MFRGFLLSGFPFRVILIILAQGDQKITQSPMLVIFSPLAITHSSLDDKK